MNIYLENAGVVRNCRYLKKLSRLLPPKERIDLFLRSQKPIGLLAQMALVMCVPTIKTMELTVSAHSLLPQLVWFANHFARYSLRFTVEKKLTGRQWKRISRLRDVICVDDRSGEDHTALYRANRRVIANTPDCRQLDTANTYYAAVKMADKQCHYTSCLGKTLFIAADGTVSFCPERPRQTAMGNLSELTQLFHTPSFMEALKAMIPKRKACAAGCKHYGSCMGGCIFRPDCSDFYRDSEAAIRDITRLIETGEDLSRIPVYKERSIVYRLFSGKPYPDSVR